VHRQAPKRLFSLHLHAVAPLLAVHARCQPRARRTPHQFVNIFFGSVASFAKRTE
jgi:hypothetical protein